MKAKHEPGWNQDEIDTRCWPTPRPSPKTILRGLGPQKFQPKTEDLPRSDWHKVGVELKWVQSSNVEKFEDSSDFDDFQTKSIASRDLKFEIFSNERRRHRGIVVYHRRRRVPHFDVVPTSVSVRHVVVVVVVVAVVVVIIVGYPGGWLKAHAFSGCHPHMVTTSSVVLWNNSVKWKNVFKKIFWKTLFKKFFKNIWFFYFVFLSFEKNF